jgi:hypothetical protein
MWRGEGERESVGQREDERVEIIREAFVSTVQPTKMTNQFPKLS